MLADRDRLDRVGVPAAPEHRGARLVVEAGRRSGGRRGGDGVVVRRRSRRPRGRCCRRCRTAWARSPTATRTRRRRRDRSRRRRSSTRSRRCRRRSARARRSGSVMSSIQRCVARYTGLRQRSAISRPPTSQVPVAAGVVPRAEERDQVLAGVALVVRALAVAAARRRRRSTAARGRPGRWRSSATPPGRGRRPAARPAAGTPSSSASAATPSAAADFERWLFGSTNGEAAAPTTGRGSCGRARRRGR